MIRHAKFPDDLHDVALIFREYVAGVAADLGFQDYEQEFAALPGSYEPPSGRILLAEIDGRIVGCAALRKVDERRCELKRVYVRPSARGQQFGMLLVVRMLEEARKEGYRQMCLDVLPEFGSAQRLYKSLGFVPSEAVSFNPVPGTLFLAIDL